MKGSLIPSKQTFFQFKEGITFQLKEKGKRYCTKKETLLQCKDKMYSTKKKRDLIPINREHFVLIKSKIGTLF